MIAKGPTEITNTRMTALASVTKGTTRGLPFRPRMDIKGKGGVRQ